MSPWVWADDAQWQGCSSQAVARAAQMVAQAAQHYETLRAVAAEQPLTAIAKDANAQEQITLQAAALAAQYERLVVVGTGGASLGAQALCALAPDPARVRFLENCDPVTLASFFKLPRESTAWLVISKSGETVETLAAALSLSAHLKGTKPGAVRVITANPTSSLGKIAASQGWEIMAHPPALGGRFSVFSVVGLLPAAFAGLDIRAILQTAEETMQHFLRGDDAKLLPHAAWIAATLQEKPMQVLMAYADRLRPATQWYKQLWAESLGKAGQGQTPVTAIGSIDQHSQLQLYLDGPRDKLVTLWLPTVAGQGYMLPSVAGLDYLAGRSMGDVMQATAEATATTLAKAGVPLRVARGVLTPESLAAWFVRQMLETLLVAALMGVDPYSQPAVEEGKSLARTALAKRSAP